MFCHHLPGVTQLWPEFPPNIIFPAAGQVVGSVQRFIHLPTHISNVHGAVEGFGCEICGSCHPAESVFRNHILEQHKLETKPR